MKTTVKKFYYQLPDVNKELNILREKGITRGKELGFDFESIGMSIKPGCTTYIAGYPGSGKSEFWLEILVNLSCLYGWKHIVFTPETGNVQQVFAELCHKYIRKPYFSTIDGCMNESERVTAEMFITDHFVVIDPKDDTITIKEYYKIVDQVEKDLDIKFNTTTIDPFNELEYDSNGMSRDLAIEKQLGDCRRNARKTGRHNCLITHVRDKALVETEGVSHLPIPLAVDFAGGQAWFRKGEQMVLIWRPPYGVTRFNKNGKYESNEVIIRVAKEKPKGSAIKGDYILFYDKHMNSYYQVNENGDKIYSKRDLQLEQMTIKAPNKDEVDNFYKNSTFERVEDEEDLLQDTPF
jgi:hypothetical protein